VNPLTNHILVIEKDYNCYTESQREQAKQKMFEQTKSKECLDVDYSKVGYPKPAVAGGYASCLRIVDPFSFETVFLQEFEDSECVFSMYVSQNVGLPGVAYLFLGIGVEATLQKTCKAAEIQTYMLTQDGQGLQLLYRTPCEQIPTAFGEIRGRLAVGVGAVLRIYEMGQKKLLRKYDNKNFKSSIISIKCRDNRLYVGDIQESVHVLKFKPEQG